MVNILSGIEELGDNILILLGNIPKFLYFVVTTVLSILDLFQYLFRRLAGLDVYYIDGVEYEGDIIYGFLTGIINGRYPALQTLFISLLILGVILLILSSIIAIMKSELNPDEKTPQGKFKAGNKKTKIFQKMFRGFFMMFIIPVASIFGIYICNVVLRAVDAATITSTNESVLQSYTFTDESGSAKSAFKENSNGTYSNYDLFGLSSPAGYTPFSGLIFRISCFDANRARKDGTFVSTVILGSESSTEYTGNFGVFNLPDNDYQIAELIDVAFANNAELNNQYRGYKIDIEKGDAAEYTEKGWDFFSGTYDNEITHFSKFNVGLVSYYYNLWMFNFIIAILFCYWIAKFYLGITFGLFKRIIMFITMFFISPVFCSILPIDNEKEPMYTKAVKKLVSNAISVIANVGAINIFMTLLPYFETLTFFPDTGVAGLEGALFKFINYIIQMIIIVAGFNMIESIIKLVESIMGSEHLQDNEGLEKTMKSIGRAGETAAGTLVATGRIAGGAGMIAGRTALTGARMVGRKIVDSRHDRLVDKNNDRIQRQTRKNTRDLDIGYQRYQRTGGTMSRQQWVRSAEGRRIQRAGQTALDNLTDERTRLNTVRRQRTVRRAQVNQRNRQGYRRAFSSMGSGFVGLAGPKSLAFDSIAEPVWGGILSPMGVAKKAYERLYSKPQNKNNNNNP